MEEQKYRTAVVPDKNRNPEFSYSKHHTQQVVTENFLKYIKDDVLKFKVLGFPDVQKVESKTAKKRT